MLLREDSIIEKLKFVRSVMLAVILVFINIVIVSASVIFDINTGAFWSYISIVCIFMLVVAVLFAIVNITLESIARRHNLAVSKANEYYEKYHELLREYLELKHGQVRVCDDE